MKQARGKAAQLVSEQSIAIAHLRGVTPFGHTPRANVQLMHKKAHRLDFLCMYLETPLVNEKLSGHKSSKG